jgi:hypothetical protein
MRCSDKDSQSASRQNIGASVPSSSSNPSPSRGVHSRGTPPHSSTAVANHHSEQRVYNKTADPPRPGVHIAHGRGMISASSLQTAPASDANGIRNNDDGSVPFHIFDRYTTQAQEYNFWLAESHSTEDPTTVRINEHFQFVAQFEMELPTPEHSNPVSHAPLPRQPHTEPVYAPHLQRSRTVRTRSR